MTEKNINKVGLHIFIITLLLITTIKTGHTQGTARDGYLWNKMDTAGKESYVVGFFEGFGAGFKNMLGAMEFLKYTEEVQAQPKDAIETLAIITQAAQNSYRDLIPDIQLTEFVREVDEFYKDYRNKQVLLPHALWIVVMDLRGDSREKIEAAVQTARHIRSNEALQNYDRLSQEESPLFKEMRRLLKSKEKHP